MSTVLTEGLRPGEFIMNEDPGNRSREAVTIAAEQVVTPNMVLGKIAVAAGVVVTQAFAGTGNGVLTVADPAVSTKVKDGDYTVVCVTAAANGGTFRVEDPNGKSIGNATVGAAFDKEIKFTIADGATDFVVGDTFTISVAADAEDYQYVPFNQDGTNGSEVPAAIAIYGVETGVGETAKITAIVRGCQANGNCIAWPSDITAAEKANANQALEKLGIIARY